MNRQRQRIEQQGIHTLAELDLAMLLRVLDENWFAISNKLGLKSEARNLVKEMPMIRNRWAHATSQGIPPNDEYRDLDTLLRFAHVIKAEDTFRQEVRIAMLALLPKIEKCLIQDDAVVSLPEINKSPKQDYVTAPSGECKNNGDMIPTTGQGFRLTSTPTKPKTRKGNPKKRAPKKGKQNVYPRPQGSLKF